MINALTASSLTGTGYSINAGAGGRATVPVSQASYIYSHFKHVSGFPAPEGVQGVPVNKIKILDALIERLSQLKKNRPPEFEINGQSDKQIDALINTLQKQLATASAAPYARNAIIPAGSFVNVSA